MKQEHSLDLRLRTILFYVEYYFSDAHIYSETNHHFRNKIKEENDNGYVLLTEILGWNKMRDLSVTD